MSRHVYPPWHSLVQKILFGIAVILCIALPVAYGGGDGDDVSSTVVIVVLVLYFVLWAVFSLFVRFGIKSYAIESKLPVHTPTPAPPLPPALLHSPADRNAVPPASAIKSASSQRPDTSDDQYTNAGKKRVVIGGARISEDVEDANRDSGSLLHNQPTSQKSLRFMDNHSRHQYPPSPATPPSSPMSAGSRQPLPSTSEELGRTGSNNNVKFASRPSGLVGEPITLEENYPTYATYRQSQHASFDMFAQRIRKALETAKAQQRELQEQQEKQQQEQLEQDRLKLEGDAQNDRTTGTGSNLLEPPSALSPNILSTVKAGRPRSSSAASMISNLSEKIRLGSNFFGRAGRSRAGSDASATVPPPTGGAGVSTPGSRLSFSGPSPSTTSVLPASEPSVSSSSTTTMAAIASAVAVATAMSLPRHSETPSNSDNPKSSHPLAQTLHIQDNSQDDSQEGCVVIRLNMPEEPVDREVGNPVQQHGHVPEDSISNDDGILVLSSEPDVEIKVER
ncbi:hypothetical protein BGX26_008376 [Mortierella sp. AD094]|nr:hypothetical protein BGX26_008376 [Mortierella sp. AD094]